MAKLVSKVYGDALFSLATEENQVDELWEEAAMVHEAVDTNPEFLSVLCHPEMTMEKKLSLLQDVFQKELSPHMMGLLNVLLKKGRIGEILPVLDYFMEQVMAYKKIGELTVRTPMPLSEGQKEKIERKLLEVSEYETVSVDYQIDESLLGGMVIRIGDRVLDNSIRCKLDAMSRQLYKVKLSGKETVV